MVEVYVLNLQNGISSLHYNQLLSHVSDSKKERISRFKFKKNACETLMSDILTRYFAMKNTGIKNTDITIVQNDYGKPYIDKLPSFHYNCTHSGEWVAIAISDMPVGVDIEVLKDMGMDIAKRFFTQKECQYIKNAPHNHRTKHFFDLWTLKEAYIKKHGKGLSIPLDSFSMNVKDNSISVEVEDDSLICYFHKYDITNNCKLSVCTHFPEEHCPITMLNRDLFIEEFLSLVNNFG